jgi:tRNA dimethylallyltransferase
LSEGGRRPLLAELAETDPESAERIHPNDDYRLLRALEVIRLTGRPLSSYAMNTEDRRSTFRFLLAGIDWERGALYSRINRRCSQMFRDGLPEEARALFDKGYTPRDPALRAIGYKEFFVDDGGFRLSEDMAGVEALVAQHSLQYAKRQITWFKRIPGVTWLRVDEGRQSMDTAAAVLQERIRSFMEEAGGL